MVSETLTEDASRLTLGAAENDLVFEIVDETSSEQVAREQRLLATDQREDATSDPQARQQPQTEQHVEPLEEPKPAATEIDEPVQRPAEHRSYTQDEVSKMQAAWARQIEDARRSASQAGEQLQQFNMDAAVEAMLRKQEQELTTSVGAEQAEKLARSPQNASIVRQSIANQQRLMQSEAGKSAAVEQQERQAKFIVAQSLMRENGVSLDDFELLTSASTPASMKRLALRLGGKDASAMRNRVPPENPQTELENGYHTGPAPESADRRLERIRAKPSWEWTESDLRYMKTGEVR